ncbi:MAG: FKBP-type peptidyl-prolyl cis-trans isomerase [Janthinobacterium lividum]
MPFARVLLLSPLLAIVLAVAAAGSAWAGTPAEAAAFLKQKSAEPGVVTLPSGLEYKVITSGDATGAHPTATSSVMVNYVGKLSDGATFDDSHDQIVTLPLGSVIKGWTEGLQLMRPGDVWMLYIPPALGYGARGAGPIPPNEALAFKIEFVDVSSH